MPNFPRDSFLDQFLKVKSDLERIVEEHLPGEFANWEEQHTSWQGTAKTVDCTGYDPRTKSCAWGLFVAFDMGEEYLGRPDRKRDLKALDDFDLSLDRAQQALQEMSISARCELYRASDKAQATVDGVPAMLFLEVAIQDGRASIPHAKKSVSEDGAAPTRRNMRAAATIAECRKIYEARTNGTAPKSARDRGQKDTISNEPALFVRFSRDVFRVLGISSEVGSALTALAKIQELDPENSANS